MSSVSGTRPQAAEAKLGISPTGRATQTYKPDNALLRFLLQHRLPQRYGIQNLGPGQVRKYPTKIGSPQ